MTYELALELKNVGFPQKSKSGYVTKAEGYIATPTLEELIEACGDNFRKLERSLDGTSWEAQSQGFVCKFGTTAEKAVANLYLALNPPPSLEAC